MEVVLIVLLPVLFLVLAGSMLVVSQFSGFFSFSRYSRRRRQDRQELKNFMFKLAMAQGQIFKRSQQLEKLSSKLKVNNQELARLNGMKTKFLSMAVHDMRTPLASIKGFGEMLSRRKLEAQDKKYADYIVRGTNQINRLMADLTDLAVIEAGKLKMEKADFDLDSFLKDVVPPISVIAKNKGVVFVPPEDVKNTPIFGDRFRLAQALNNFLTNAVKFTPASGKVELKVNVVGRKITFAVKDSGPGIHPNERKRVFEKFYQSQYQSQKKKGWGLGLSIAQEIVVKGHQGDVGVESQGLGRGATFWLRIPTVKSRGAAGRLGKIAAALLLAVGISFPAAAQEGGFPIEEKAKFERSVEHKAESVLLKILGPNRFRVVVDATLDFTRIERFSVKRGVITKDPSSLYLWQNIGVESGGREQLLPGIPAPQVIPEATGARSYERQNTFPSRFIKRLSVTIVLDRSIPRARGDEIAKIVAEILDTQPARGDVLNIVYAPFAPAWKTIWYTPEATSLMFKYAMISLMTLITLIVVAACFLKLAEAMDSMAQAQSTQLSMDIGDRGGAAGGEVDGDGKKVIEGEVEKTEEGAGGVVFNVKAEQIPTLLEIIRGQDPENVALIVAHLPFEIRREFLDRLPSQMHSAVLMNLGRIRFMEPDVLETIKEELERRLESAVGGEAQLLGMIEQSDLKAKKQLLLLLQERDPRLARLVRSRILLFEDLVWLESRDWSLLLTVVPIEDWGPALADADDEIKNAVKKNMAIKTWKIVMQMIAAFHPSEQASGAARERIVEAAEKLIEEGRIGNPAPTLEEGAGGASALIEEAAGA
ncbi:MAG: ATP-binding protein [Elusimicrobiota bacterium]